MKLINKDLTRESVSVYVSNNQIYAKVHYKSHGKWTVDEYFKSYDWANPELIKSYVLDSTIRYICRTWGLKNPKLSINI